MTQCSLPETNRRFLLRLKRTSSVDISLAQLQIHTHRPCGCIHQVRKLNYKCPASTIVHCSTVMRGSTGPLGLGTRAAFKLARCRPTTIRPGTMGTGRMPVQCLHVYVPENKLQPVITVQRYLHAHFLAKCVL